MTSTNRKHRNVVWKLHYVDIEIPKMIDDYNHWMNAVDRTDQYIAYYRPVLRCYRTWMPIMMHCLNIIRTNAYVIAKNREPTYKSKDFIVEFIACLNARASAERLRMVTHSSEKKSKGGRKVSGVKRKRMSPVNPKMSERRFEGKIENHVVTLHVAKQKQCVYCAYLKAKGEGITDKPKRVKRMCMYCNVHLCKDHFDSYHGR